MITITKLKMWKDVNYTKRCVEVPPVGSVKLPAVADYTLGAGETLRPRKDSTFMSLKLGISYLSVFDMSYMYIEASDGNTSVSLFGWIDTIEEVASTEPTVRINWSVDWWRSYSDSVTFGPGILTRCSDATLRRPYNVNPRIRKVNKITAIFPNDTDDPTGRHDLWVVVTVVLTYNSGGNNYSTISRYCFPAGTDVYDQNGPITAKSLTVSNCYNGYLDELFASLIAGDIQADNYELVSAHVSPIPPDTDLVWDSVQSAWKGLAVVSGTLFGNTYGAFWMGSFNASSSFGAFTVAISTPIKTDDKVSYHITDFDGNIIGNLPWGLEFNRILSQVDIGPAGGYMKVYFYSATDATNIQVKAIGNGMAFSIPLPSIPITTNYWSDYVLSGQRNYDRENKEIAREQTAVQGLTSIGSSLVGGAITGALVAGPGGALAGAAAGAGVGAIGSLASTGINYWTTGMYNDRLNDLNDQLYSRQKNTIQENGYSEYWRILSPINGMVGPRLLEITIDSVSEGEMDNDIAYNGYKTQLPLGSVSSYITSGGPIQISQLVVTGSAPPVAKDAIKNILENGVRIIENNPSGVSP